MLPVDCISRNCSLNAACWWISSGPKGLLFVGSLCQSVYNLVYENICHIQWNSLFISFLQHTTLMDHSFWLVCCTPFPGDDLFWLLVHKHFLLVNTLWLVDCTYFLEHFVHFHSILVLWLTELLGTAVSGYFQAR